jgi:hypothetical protein
MRAGFALLRAVSCKAQNLPIERKAEDNPIEKKEFARYCKSLERL